MCTQLIGVFIMSANVERVGIREFRENLQLYLLASAPVAITRHGETVGFYIPAHSHPEEAELAALKSAAIQFEKLLADQGVNEEELFSEFRALREGKKR
jgi:hypothetical protein